MKLTSSPTIPTTYDTAYPGSMFEKAVGNYVRRDDPASLAAALLETIQAQQNHIEDLEALVRELRIEIRDLERALPEEGKT